MVKGHGKELNNQRGSATIEAVIGFTAFLFAIFTILGLVNFCRAQMLVSSAVDTAAKEMSQYAYFYQMSGLQKFEEKLDDNASVGKNNINEVIGTVDQLYSSINGAVEQTVQEKTNVANMIAAGDADMQTFENAITGIENSAEGVMQGITGVSNALKDVGNDPLLYMRSLVALIGSEGMEAAKRAVAVPLARSFVSKHFGEDTDAANAKLESLGIEGGLDSMNFNLSNIFSDDKHQDIEITVIYKVKLLQVFEWVVLEANVSKVAVCRAWLGGDDVIVKAVSSEQPPLGTESSTTEEEETDETTESTDPTEETTEPSEEKVDTTGSYWHLGVDKNGWDNKAASFDDLLVNSKGITREELVVNGVLYGRDSNNVAYGMDFCVEAKEVHSNLIYMDSIESIKLMEDNYVKTNGEYGYAPGSTHTYKYVIYVPENIPEDELNGIKTASQDYREEFSARAREEYGLDISVSVEIIKAGGNYDYSSGGAE